MISTGLYAQGGDLAPPAAWASTPLVSIQNEDAHHVCLQSIRGPTLCEQPCSVILSSLEKNLCDYPYAIIWVFAKDVMERVKFTILLMD